MIDYEIFGLRFSLINTIIFVFLGMLMASLTVCSCCNMEQVMKKDFEYEIKKFIHDYL